jgi:hypothetical protein
MDTLTAPAAEYVAAYGLARPTVADARAAVERVLRSEAAPAWARIVQAAGGTDERTLELARVIEAMARDTDDVVRLCARALSIRTASFDRLAATHAIVTA